MPKTEIARISAPVARVGSFMSCPRWLQPEDPHDAALTRMAPDVLHEIRRRPHIRGIVRAHISREQEPVTAESCIDGNVLLAIRSAIRDRVADDARADFEFRQKLAGSSRRRT